MDFGLTVLEISKLIWIISFSTRQLSFEIRLKTGESFKEVQLRVIVSNSEDSS